MSKLNGVDFANISSLSGRSFFDTGGGLSAVPATTDSGVLLCPYNLPVARPWSDATFEDYENPVHMFQIADFTGVKKIANSIYHMGILLDNGNLYTSGWSNSPYFGLSSADGTDAINNANFKLSLTNVKTFGCTIQGFMAIKNDGTLWFAGSVSNYLNATGLGGGSTVSAYGWRQIGTDTDWHDLDVYPNYPYLALAVKGASGSRYLYAAGYSTNYQTGQGVTSPSFFSFTRVKSAASTDLTESFDKVKVSYGSCLAVTETGKLFSWGENGRGNLGTGNTTDKPYATQVGSDTDWDDCWVQRYGAFAKKTDGTMYMSTSSSSWRIEPNTNKVFTQIGTDTDYEDLALFANDSSTHDYTVFAKKNGSWYGSTTGTPAGGWVGSSSLSATTQGSWVAINTMLQENDITGTVDLIHCLESPLVNNESVVIFAVS
jgi:hypothetical protein